MFKNKKVLVTGGTGSFGSVFVRKLIDLEADVLVLSRDEKKQEELRFKFDNEKIEFAIGDVRDANRLINISKNVDYVFHAAALKQVPSCEFNPMEAVKTNILGANNVIEACNANNIKKAVFLSTDKAVYPINSMGISKAMMEKIIISQSLINNSKTTFCLTRYGNVMGSRGSVIPLFIDQCLKGIARTITTGSMTRFLMSLEDSVNLVLYAFENGNNGDLFIQKSPACTIDVLEKAISSVCKVSSKVKNIGGRHGEKNHESLMSKEERLRSTDLGDYFKVSADKRNLSYNKFVVEGVIPNNQLTDYNSSNTIILEKSEVENLLLKQQFVRSMLKND